MNLEKNELLRSATPGYIYLLVILSFKILIERSISFKIEEFAPLLISGFPIGYIIQAIYRWWHSFFGDHSRMEQVEAAILQDELNNDLIQRIPTTPPQVFLIDRPGRRLSWFMESFLMECGNSEIRDRLRSLMLWVHSLGGSSFSIIIACLTLIIYTKAYALNFLLFLSGWILIALILARVRTDTQNIFHVVWRHFVYINRKKITTFIEERNK